MVFITLLFRVENKTAGPYFSEMNTVNLISLRQWHSHLGNSCGTKPFSHRHVHLNLRTLACQLDGQAVRLEERELGLKLQSDWIPWPLEDEQNILADSLVYLLDGVALLSGPNTCAVSAVQPLAVDQVHDQFVLQARFLQAAVKRQPNIKAKSTGQNGAEIFAANDVDQLSDYLTAAEQDATVGTLQALTLGVATHGMAHGYDPEQTIARWHERRRGFFFEPPRFKAPYHLLRLL